MSCGAKEFGSVPLPEGVELATALPPSGALLRARVPGDGRHFALFLFFSGAAASSLSSCAAAASSPISLSSPVAVAAAVPASAPVCPVSGLRAHL